VKGIIGPSVVNTGKRLNANGKRAENSTGTAVGGGGMGAASGADIGGAAPLFSMDDLVARGFRKDPLRGLAGPTGRPFSPPGNKKGNDDRTTRWRGQC